jgi:hypothetical protein
MKIITTKGELMKVGRVTAYAEAAVSINGGTKNVYAKPDDIKYATGLIFERESVNNNIVWGQVSNNFVIGNLDNEKLQEILTALCEKGYYDFSKLSYQSAKVMEKAVIDGGLSLPYCSDHTMIDFALVGNLTSNFGSSNVFSSNFDPNSIWGNSEGEDLEADEDGDDGDDGEDIEC